ncbi:MAG: NAD(+) diphosphatase [Lentisphaeria bacterium]|nr:NAD(+) diphosphatase [Lentisphaeria bacterium]
MAKIAAGHPDREDRVVLFDAGEALAAEEDGRLRLPRAAEIAPGSLTAEGRLFLGMLDGVRCFAVRGGLPEKPERPVIRVGCRRMLADLSDAERNAFCRGRELVLWRASHRYCGACRSELLPSANDSALICPVCGTRYYPQLSPAVITAVTRNGGRELLLAHNRGFEPGIYSLIAGFVEAGESAEAAVRREIMEECGIQVRNVRYLTSQVWPFPNSLMLAFAAEYDSGTAAPDGEELTDLGWFTAEEHPRLPGAGSVARRVIDMVFDGKFR